VCVCVCVCVFRGKDRGFIVGVTGIRSEKELRRPSQVWVSGNCVPRKLVKYDVEVRFSGIVVAFKKSSVLAVSGPFLLL